MDETKIRLSMESFLSFYCFVLMTLCLVFQNFLFKAHRLNSKVINYTHAETGLDCLLLCVRDNKYCRSINFNLTSNSDRNCEFLKDVSTEKPELLLKDEDYYYYILLIPNRVNTEKYLQIRSILGRSITEKQM